MSAAALPFEAPRPVARKVSRLRLLVRLYVLLEGLAAAAIAAGAAFWLGLAIDWLFEPSPALRVALWAVAAVALAAVVWRYLARRLFAGLRSDSLALLVERRFPHLAEGLITTVQAARTTDDPTVRRELIDATARRAAADMEQVGLLRVFDFRPLVTKTLIAAALGAGALALALGAPEAFGFWMARMRLTPELWPRRVELTVVGFDRAHGGVINVARNDEFPLEVLASIVDGHEAPAVVEVRWRRPSDGVRGGGPMLRIGEATPGRDAAQRYTYAFKVGADLEFDVIGGDDRIRNLRLHAVERPTATRIALDVTYPKYIDREPRTIAVSGRAELPEGASAVCRIEANKPLESVRVQDPAEQTDVPATVTPGRPQEFTFGIASSSADRVFLITLHDADGVENREPFRLPVAVVPDLVPEIAVQLRGIGTAVTPQARIPLAGKLTDDYALIEAWFEYEVDQAPAERRPLAAQPDGLTQLRMTEAFDLSDADPQTNRPRVELKPGQRLALTLKARDAYDLGGAPHIGSSGRFRLDVVTASELRALLERRELGLRQRFEQIYEKMQGVEDLLGRIDLAHAANPADDNPGSAPAPTTNDAADAAPSAGPRSRRREPPERDAVGVRDQRRGRRI